MIKNHMIIGEPDLIRGAEEKKMMMTRNPNGEKMYLSVAMTAVIGQY